MHQTKMKKEQTSRNETRKVKISSRKVFSRMYSLYT